MIQDAAPPIEGADAAPRDAEPDAQRPDAQTPDAQRPDASLADVPLADAPTPDAGALELDEDQEIEVLLEASDFEGAPLSYIVVMPPMNGVLEGLPPRLTYRPDRNFFGGDRLGFQANDGLLRSDETAVELTVQEVCDPPRALDVALFPPEHEPIEFTLSATDPDLPGVPEVLVYEVLIPPAQGELLGLPPVLTWRPFPGATGVDTFTWQVSDGRCGQDTAVVQLRIGDVDDRPSVAPLSVETDEDTPVELTLSGSDPDGAEVVFLVGQPAHGDLREVVPGRYEYTPEADSHGPDGFDYTVSDGALDSLPAHVSILVLAVNDAPRVDVGGDRTVDFNGETLNLEALVSDDGDPPGAGLSFVWYATPAPGAVHFDPADAANTAVRFTTPGLHRLTLAVSDGLLVTEDTLEVEVRDVGENQAPRVNAGADQVVRGALEVSLLAAATDDGRPGGALTLSWTLDDGPGTATFSLSDALATSVALSAPGVYVLRLTADDGELSAFDVVTVEVGQNRAPTVDAGPDRRFSGRFASLDASALDDGDALTFAWTLEGGPAAAPIDAAQSAHTSATFEVAGDYRFRVTVSDGELTAFDEVVLTLEGNLPPVANAGDDVELVLPPRLDMPPPVTHSDPPEPEWRQEIEAAVFGSIFYSGLSATEEKLWVGFTGQQLAGVPTPAGLVSWDDCRWEAPPPPLASFDHGIHSVPVTAGGNQLLVGGVFDDLTGSRYLSFSVHYDGQRWASLMPPVQIGWFQYWVGAILPHGLYVGGFFDLMGGGSRDTVPAASTTGGGIRWRAGSTGVSGRSSTTGPPASMSAGASKRSAAPTMAIGTTATDRMNPTSSMACTRAWSPTGTGRRGTQWAANSRAAIGSVAAPRSSRWPAKRTAGYTPAAAFTRLVGSRSTLSRAWTPTAGSP